MQIHSLLLAELLFREHAFSSLCRWLSQVPMRMHEPVHCQEKFQIHPLHKRFVQASLMPEQQKIAASILLVCRGTLHQHKRHDK